MRRPSYREEEVRGLIETYPELREKVGTHRSGLRFLVMLADLDRAMARLPRKYWEVVLLHGLLGHDQGTTAQLLQVSHQAVSKRYRRAIEEVTYFINGGE